MNANAVAGLAITEEDEVATKRLLALISGRGKETDDDSTSAVFREPQGHKLNESQECNREVERAVEACLAKSDFAGAAAEVLKALQGYKGTFFPSMAHARAADLYLLAKNYQSAAEHAMLVVQHSSEPCDINLAARVLCQSVRSLHASNRKAAAAVFKLSEEDLDNAMQSRAPRGMGDTSLDVSALLAEGKAAGANGEVAKSRALFSKALALATLDGLVSFQKEILEASNVFDGSESNGMSQGASSNDGVATPHTHAAESSSSSPPMSRHSSEKSKFQRELRVATDDSKKMEASRELGRICLAEAKFKDANEHLTAALAIAIADQNLYLTQVELMNGLVRCDLHRGENDSASNRGIEALKVVDKIGADNVGISSARATCSATYHLLIEALLSQKGKELDVIQLIERYKHFSFFDKLKFDGNGNSNCIDIDDTANDLMQVCRARKELFLSFYIMPSSSTKKRNAPVLHSFLLDPRSGFVTHHVGSCTPLASDAAAFFDDWVLSCGSGALEAVAAEQHLCGSTFRCYNALLGPFESLLESASQGGYGLVVSPCSGQEHVMWSWLRKDINSKPLLGRFQGVLVVSCAVTYRSMIAQARSQSETTFDHNATVIFDPKLKMSQSVLPALKLQGSEVTEVVIGADGLLPEVRLSSRYIYVCCRNEKKEPTERVLFHPGATCEVSGDAAAFELVDRLKMEGHPTVLLDWRGKLSDSWKDTLAIVRALRAAGACAVVLPYWPCIEDQDLTGRVNWIKEFHERISEGRSPVEAAHSATATVSSSLLNHCGCLFAVYA